MSCSRPCDITNPCTSHRLLLPHPLLRNCDIPKPGTSPRQGGLVYPVASSTGTSGLPERLIASGMGRPGLPSIQGGPVLPGTATGGPDCPGRATRKPCIAASLGSKVYIGPRYREAGSIPVTEFGRPALPSTATGHPFYPAASRWLPSTAQARDRSCPSSYPRTCWGAKRPVSETGSCPLLRGGCLGGVQGERNRGSPRPVLGGNSGCWRSAPCSCAAQLGEL